MKKNLVLGFLILFVLSTTAFAGFGDPKKGTEKPAVTNPRENKLSDEELSRLTRRAETSNPAKTNLINKDNSDSKNLKASNQVIVENRRHGTYIYGGLGLVLIIILILVLI